MGVVHIINCGQHRSDRGELAHWTEGTLLRAVVESYALTVVTGIRIGYCSYLVWKSLSLRSS
jgi:hypothetical protein